MRQVKQGSHAFLKSLHRRLLGTHFVLGARLASCCWWSTKWLFKKTIATFELINFTPWESPCLSLHDHLNEVLDQLRTPRIGAFGSLQLQTGWWLLDGKPQRICLKLACTVSHPRNGTVLRLEILGLDSKELRQHIWALLQSFACDKCFTGNGLSTVFLAKHVGHQQGLSLACLSGLPAAN